MSYLSIHAVHIDIKLCVQDTCVALQALSEYAILSYVGGVNLTISLASTNLDFQETFELNRDNKKLLQSARVMRDEGGRGERKLSSIDLRLEKPLSLPMAESLLCFNNELSKVLMTVMIFFPHFKGGFWRCNFQSSFQFNAVINERLRSRTALWHRTIISMFQCPAV